MVVWWATMGLALLLVTWKLWIPQTVYPQVPLIALGHSLPAWVDWLALLGMAAALIWSLSFGLFPAGLPRAVGGRLSSDLVPTAPPAGAVACFVGCYTLSVVIDQHRLQPWAYHLAIFGALLAWHRRPGAIIRWLLISIYFYSALGKLDITFAQTVGTQMVRVPTLWLRMQVPTERLVSLARALPWGELLLAVSLAWPATFRWGCRLAIVAHVFLLAVLGPWGLDHENGVLLWNVFFIGIWCLYYPAMVPSRAAPIGARGRGRDSWQSRCASVLAAAALLLPLLESVGGWDHWLSWGLYSPRNSRATLWLHDSQVDRERLGVLQAYLEPPDARGWRQVDIDRWSLQELKVPIYPQDRFQWGVAVAVVRQLDLERGFRLEVYSMADRFTGERSLRRATSRSDLSTSRWPWHWNAQPKWKPEA